MKRLFGRYALVTGGTSGIGGACARAMAREGAAVVAAGRRGLPGPLTAPAAGQVTTCALDVTDEASVVQRIDEMPALDLLVCAAGVGVFTSILRTTVADLRQLLEVDVVGTFLCAREALRRMAEQRRGHIVVIGSISSQRWFVDCGAYTAAKAGQHGFAKVLAEEARPYNVRVTLVLPGATDTAIWDGRPGFDRDRMMSPDDLAGVIVSAVVRPSVAIEELTVLPPAGAL
ncbi:MAG: SDR family oxidoreductase [Myxococcales bacterium]|nr:SDR family oxidoreductase [Myxococcales bacterium]